MEHYTHYIKSNPAWDFAGIYADNAKSAKNKGKRPEFLRMVKDAESKKFDLIITKSIFRFARNQIDCLETVRKLKSIGSREKYANRYPFSGSLICGHCGNRFKRHIDNCGTVAESAGWICTSYVNEGKFSCDVGRVKEETLKGLFVRMYNRLYAERKLLGEYKQRMEKERFDDGRIAELDQEIECLLKQERQLLFYRRKRLR